MGYFQGCCRWTSLILALVLGCIPITALADATRGELFGYRIGDRYTASTNLTRDAKYDGKTITAVASNPAKPPDMGDVYLGLYIWTRTIRTIYSITEFTWESEADSFKKKYSQLLQEKYVSARAHVQKSPPPGVPDTILELNTQGYYISLTKKAIPTRMPLINRWAVEIMLYRWNINSDDDIIEREYSEFMRDQDARPRVRQGGPKGL